MALEPTVNELQTDKTWWKWWYGSWGRWLQTNVLRLSDAMRTISNAWSRSSRIQEQEMQQEHRQQHQQYIARHVMEVPPGEGWLGTP